MRNFIRTLAVCIAVISTSIPIMAQQISIVSGKVLNLPEGAVSYTHLTLPTNSPV